MTDLWHERAGVRTRAPSATDPARRKALQRFHEGTGAAPAYAVDRQCPHQLAEPAILPDAAPSHMSTPTMSIPGEES